MDVCGAECAFFEIALDDVVTAGYVEAFDLPEPPLAPAELPSAPDVCDDCVASACLSSPARQLPSVRRGKDRGSRPARLASLPVEEESCAVAVVRKLSKSLAAGLEYNVNVQASGNRGNVPESGEEVSSREVKKILSDAIEAEEKRHPLADEKLAQLLKEKGYTIARRTVAKYREQLGIPVARLRKEL